MKLKLALGAVLLFGLVGCSEPSDQQGSTGGEAGDASAGGAQAAGTTATGPGGASEGGAGAAPLAPACNELELDAPPVGFSYDEGVAPDPTGGEIADGMYFLTAQVLYETASGPTLALGRTQVQIGGSTWQEVSGDAELDSINPDRRSTSTLTLSGTTLELQRSCPSDGQPESADYSVHGDGFTLYLSQAGKTFGSVFTKQ